MKDREPKSTVTIKLTAGEAEWLISQLNSLANRAQDAAEKAETHVAKGHEFKTRFQANSLIDRIRSEQ